MKYQFLAVEGPIGVGKTTLAKQLAERCKASFMTDTDARNPYLDAFYREPARSAFHTQIHFLLSRLQVLANPAVARPTQPIVADFMLDKDRLFAELTLDHTEWWMYSQIYERQRRDLPQPDFVIYLQAPVERLIERIEKRGLDRERRIDSQYLQQLIQLYERFFLDYSQSTLLIINATDINLADNADTIDRLVDYIDNLDGGRHYYNPLVAS